MLIFSHTKLVLARDEITVKGTASRDVTADNGIWTVSLSVTRPTRQASLSEMERQQRLVSDYVSQFEDFAITTGIPKTLEDYEYNGNDRVLRGYASSISFKINASEVDQLYQEAVAFNTFAVENDLDISGNNTDFYYSKLDSLKITLLEEAVRDAKNRAQALGSSTGTKVGKVKQASQGVFQVNERNSIDVSAGGNFNTESVDKTIQTTVNVTFEVL